MASIADTLRTTILSLKQISDRLKSLITTSVTKSEATAAKNVIIAAMPSTTGLATETNATSNKQSIIDAINSAQPDLSSVAKESSATVNKNEVKQEIRNVAGPCIVPDFESEYGLNVYNFFPCYENDGEFIIDTEYETELDDLEVGSIVKVTAFHTEEYSFSVPKSVDSESVYLDGENILHGVTESMLVEAGKYYIVTGIYDDILNTGNAIYTYAEVNAGTITDFVNKAANKIKEAVDNIDLSTVAKQGADPMVTLTATQGYAQSAATDAAAAKTAAQAITGYATETNATANKNAILAAMPNTSGLATSSDVSSTQSAIISALPTIPTDYAKESTLQEVKSIDSDVMTALITLMAYFGYRADSTDTTPTPTEVIDISKQAYADAFDNDLPSGFVMPNSCTVDGTTYYGTVNS